MKLRQVFAWILGIAIALLAVLCVSNLRQQITLNANEQRLRVHYQEQLQCLDDAELIEQTRRDSIRSQIEQQQHVQAMIPWCQNRKDFVVRSGKRFVSHTTASSRPYGRLTLRVYIPPGNHQLKYAYQETWGDNHQPQQVELRKTDPRQWRQVHDISLPTGNVHEINFLIESNEDQTQLVIAASQQEEERHELKHSRCNGYSAGAITVTQYPNETVRVFNDDGTSEFEDAPLNEIVNHGFSLHAWDNRSMKGGVAVRCWLESDVPRVMDANHVVAIHDWMIAPEDDAKKKFEQMFEPYRGDGVFRVRTSSGDPK